MHASSSHSKPEHPISGDSRALMNQWKRVRVTWESNKFMDTDLHKITDGMFLSAFSGWQKTSAEIVRLESLLGHLERKVKKLETQYETNISAYNSALIELKSMNEHIQRLKAERDQRRAIFKNAGEMIKENIRNQPSHQVFSTKGDPDVMEVNGSSSASVTTDEERKHRRSISQPSVVVARFGIENSQTVELEKLPEEQNDVIKYTPKNRINLKRSISESYAQCPYGNPSYSSSTSGINFGNSWTHGRSIDECNHRFISSSGLFYFCAGCNKSLGVKCFRCQECKIYVHERCRDTAPRPCVQIIQVSQKTTPYKRPRLGDICPQNRPQIPGQLIRCVFAIEHHYIKTAGLYRIKGSDNDVKRLADEFNSKVPPKLELKTPETITGYMIKFLQELQDSIIPQSTFQEINIAVQQEDEHLLKQAIEDLCRPHLDTLSYLCAHWQNVAANAQDNLMSVENLARILGPVIIAGGDNEQKTEIMLALLRINHEYWTNTYENCNATSSSSKHRMPKGTIGRSGKTPLTTALEKNSDFDGQKTPCRGRLLTYKNSVTEARHFNA